MATAIYQIPSSFTSSSATITGDSTTNNRVIISGSNAAVSSSGTGSIRFNSGTNHFEFSENGNTYQQFGSGGGGGMVIGNTVTSGTAKSVLFVDGSGNLGQDNTNFNWDTTNHRLGIRGVASTYPIEITGDGYLSSRVIINGSTAAVSPSGAGALRFNVNTNHLEFSENTGSWTQFGTGSLAIGAAVTSGTSKSVLYVDGSSNLAQDNANFAWDFTNHRLGIDTNSPAYTLHVVGDIYATSRDIITGSTAAVSPSGTGAIRFNSGTNHLEFSENGGAYIQFGSGGSSTVTDQANAKDVLLTSTSATTIATFTPGANGNFIIFIYHRVVTATTTTTITVSWSDNTGSQSQTVINAQSNAVGSYITAPIYINSTTSAITVSATAGTANQLFVSANIVGMS